MICPFTVSVFAKAGAPSPSTNAAAVDATRRFVSPGIIDWHSRERANGPRVPGELAKAGVTSAFESAGLTDPKDFVRNAAKAVKAGLSADAALRAMTIGAAAIAG